MLRKQIVCALPEELIGRLKQAADVTGLPMNAIISRIISNNFDSWIKKQQLNVRQEVIQTIDALVLERQLKDKTRGWVIRRCLRRHPDITLDEMAVLGKRMAIGSNWIVKRWNQQQAELSEIQSEELEKGQEMSKETTKTS